MWDFCEERFFSSCSSLSHHHFRSLHAERRSSIFIIQHDNVHHLFGIFKWCIRCTADLLLYVLCAICTVYTCFEYAVHRELKCANDKLLTNLYYKSSSKRTTEVYFKSVYRPIGAKFIVYKWMQLIPIIFFYSAENMLLKSFSWLNTMYFSDNNMMILNKFKCKLSWFRYGWLNCHEIFNIIQ